MYLFKTFRKSQTCTDESRHGVSTVWRCFLHSSGCFWLMLSLKFVSFIFKKRTFTPFPANLHFQNPPSPLQGPATRATRCDLHLLSSPVGINGCDVPRRRTHRRCAAPAAGVRSVLLVSNRTREAIGNARHSRPRPPSHIRNLSTQKETVGINPFDDVSEEWILVLFQQKCMIFKCSQALRLLVWQSSAALNTLVYVWRATQQLISVSFTKLQSC